MQNSLSLYFFVDLRYHINYGAHSLMVKVPVCGTGHTGSTPVGHPAKY